MNVKNNEKPTLLDEIYKYDDSAYTLQQKALYMSRCHRFDEAFELIDKASMKMPENFSIKNTKAIITFEANKGSLTPETRKQLDNAMAILEECHKSDKRKVFHAQKYAEFALFINNEFKDNKYMETAKGWLDSIISDGGPSRKTKDLMSQLMGVNLLR